LGKNSHREPAAGALGAGRQAAARCRADAVRLLITGQVLPTNPAAVRDPKHLVTTGKPPILKDVEWRKLLDSIPATTLRDQRGPRS
jgi:hypothetical protein